jgi:hypothetical protein
VLAACLDPGYEFEIDPMQAEVAFVLSERWSRAAGGHGLERYAPQKSFLGFHQRNRGLKTVQHW